MIKRISLIVIRVLVGVMFIYSGWSKVSPIEPLEFTMLEYTHLPWFLNSVVARLLISLEILLGVMLVFCVRPKTAIKVSCSLLVLFTLYLIFVLSTQGNDGNCGCFGIKHTFTPLEGIFKNIFTLVLLAVFAKWNTYRLFFNSEKNFFLVLILASIAFPFIKEPMDVSVEDKFEESIGKDIGLDSLSSTIYYEQEVEITKGKHLVAFFSMGCKYCKLTTQKLALIASRTNKDFKRFYFFGKNKEKIPQYKEDLLKFWKTTKSDVVPNKVLEKEHFYKLAGFSLPAIYLVEDGKVIKQLSFRSVDEETIDEFLSN